MAKGFVGVRLPEDMIEAAKTVADGEHRTLSNYILTLIAADLERRATTGTTLRDDNKPYGTKTTRATQAAELRAANKKLKEARAAAARLKHS